MEGKSWLDLSQAVVLVVPGSDGLARKAAEVLVEEVEKRTNIHLPTTSQYTPGDTSVILLGEGSPSLIRVSSTCWRKIRNSPRRASVFIVP
jgi:hypothetical protein